jgi:hypothetical protein
MRKIKLLILAICGICTVSCNDFLDTKPQDGIGSDNMWKTPEHAELGVTAIYHAVRQKNVYTLYGMNDCFTPIAFCMNTGGSFDEFRSYTFCCGTATSSTKLFSDKWESLYVGIARANDAIAHLPGMEALTETQRNGYLAEAHFLRALFYFNLLDFYSGFDADDAGIPLYLEPIDYENAYLPRAKPGAVKAAMLDDLNFAIQYLPAKAVKGRANKWAAYVLKGKVYLFGKEWKKAGDNFGQVILNGPYKLHNDYYDLFQLSGENNEESIFVISNLADNYGSFTDLLYSTRSGNCAGTNTSIPTPTLVDTYAYKDGTPFNMDEFKAAFKTKNGRELDWKKKEDVEQVFANRDPRLEASIIRPYATFVGSGGKTYEFRYPYDKKQDCLRTNNELNNHYCWRKFVNVGNETTIRRHSPTDWPIMRLGDVLLMFSEARNEDIGAVDSVRWAYNQIRTRPTVNMPTISLSESMDKDGMRQLIRNERIVELAGEGYHYSDMRRWYRKDPGFDISTLSHDVNEFTGKKMETRKFTKREFLFAIPQSELDMNPYLKPQNMGWEN